MVFHPSWLNNDLDPWQRTAVVGAAEIINDLIRVLCSGFSTLDDSVSGTSSPFFLRRAANFLLSSIRTNLDFCTKWKGRRVYVSSGSLVDVTHAAKPRTLREIAEWGYLTFCVLKAF